MFYMDIRHNVKKANSSKNAFHYLTRTGHFFAKKQDEELEFVRSGHLPTWAKNRPADFWKSADQHEIERGRTSTVLTVALPKELNRLQRIELVESFIQEFTDTYQFPYTAAVHHHASALTGEDQPHLHLMYSERSLADGIERSPEQFFKQYRPKNPQQGGAQKMTANALGQGKNQVVIFRQTTEQLLNDCLQQYAPQKTIMLNGLALTVENKVSYLSNRDYNTQFGTDLKDVPQIPRWKLYSADPIIQLDIQAQKEIIQRIREENKVELYKHYYEAELNRRKQADKRQENRVETDRSRAHERAQERLRILKDQMQQALMRQPDASDPIVLIDQDLIAYVDTLNQGYFSRLDKINYLNALKEGLNHSVVAGQEVLEKIDFIRDQVISSALPKPNIVKENREIESEKGQDNDYGGLGF